ncbi:agglutinin biogenesis protein MshK [Dongshaea marina]|uniref:agglutinin biogenesis protein MshK n=1 Tax=Dongshaea marina TaxID=2047966 RepID=UPI000D3E3896|nr:agglutinin biogenesis protein MshK [Dongshaea marina]
MAKWWILLLWMVSLTGIAAPEVLKDPTQPPGQAGIVAEGTQTGELRLQSIIIRGSAHEAIIDGQQVRVGDELQGYKVLQIDPMSVTLSKAGKERVLRMYDSKIKIRR